MFNIDLAKIVNAACIQAGITNNDGTASKSKLRQKSGVNNVAIAKMFDNDKTVKLCHFESVMTACGIDDLSQVKR